VYLAASGDLGGGLDRLLLLPLVRLPARAAVCGWGVQEGSQQGRIRDSASSLQAAEELVARGCELIRAKRRKLGVR
jgi:hypothetical protein